jgi:hypothetical protein
MGDEGDGGGGGGGGDEGKADFYIFRLSDLLHYLVI